LQTKINPLYTPTKITQLKIQTKTAPVNQGKVSRY